MAAFVGGSPATGSETFSIGTTRRMDQESAHKRDTESF